MPIFGIALLLSFIIMKKLITILVLIILLSKFLFSQNMEIKWQQCYGGSEQDNTYDIIAVSGGYLIIGWTESNDGDISFNNGGSDGWIIKTDSTGNILWEKTYGGTKGDNFRRIIPDNNGNYFILGASNSSDGDVSYDPYTDSWDHWLLKIDLDGNIIWDIIIGGNESDVLWTGSPTIDGGVVALGWTYSNDGDVSVNYGGADTWMVKINSEGELEWDFTIGTDWIDKGQAVMQTSDGGYLAASNSWLGDGGNITCESHGMAEAVLTKLDADRNIEWQNCYGGSDHDGIVTLLEVEDGYIFGAYTNSNDGDVSGWHGENDFWIVKIDYFGNIIWQNPIGGSRSEMGKNIFQTTNGGICAIINTYSNDGDVSGNHSLSEYDSDIWMIKLSDEGELLTQKCFGGLGKEYVEFGVVKKNDNNFVIAGQTDYGPSYDVGCTPHGGNGVDRDFWVFEIADCTQNTPATPQTPTGNDTVCINVDTATAFLAANPPQINYHYEWEVIPGSAGTMYGYEWHSDVVWSPGFEGVAAIRVRDIYCGTSEWSEPHYVYVTHCLGVNELQAGNLKLKVYPNPARDYVVFELSTTNYNNVISKSSVIPNPGAGQSARVRNLPAMKNNQRINDSHNSKEIPHPNAQNQPKGFGMTASNGMTGVDGMTVVVFNIFGQEVIRLPVEDEKTVPTSASLRRALWDTRNVKNGIYFYHLEIEGKMVSGKVIVQK